MQSRLHNLKLPALDPELQTWLDAQEQGVALITILNDSTEDGGKSLESAKAWKDILSAITDEDSEKAPLSYLVLADIENMNGMNLKNL